MSANPIGIVSMYFARPFTAAHFPVFSRIKGVQADFVELLVPEDGELDLPATRSAIEAAGLDVVLAARVNLARNLASLDNQPYENGIAYLKYCVDVAVALGARIVGGPLYGAPLVFAGRAPSPIDSPTRTNQIQRVVAGLKIAAQYASDHGVKLAIEPLNRFETDFVNTASDGFIIVESVNSPALGIVLDTFHMNMEEDDMASAIEYVKDHLLLFQANENHRGQIGTGHIDWKKIAKALAAIDYRGPITTEPFLRDVRGSLRIPRAQWHPSTWDDENLEDMFLQDSIARLHLALREARVAP